MSSGWVTPVSTRIGAHAGVDAGDDVGVHAVADHDGLFGMDAQVVERRAHHQRVGLAHEEGALARGRLDERGHGPAGGHDAALRSARTGPGWWR